MINPRFYGKPPYNVALIHGGPGGAGEMAPDFGILEPLQTMTPLKGQVDQLAVILGRGSDHPVILVGFSWGAWLADFRFIRLSQCGHKPWIERQARDQFYEILRAELHEA